MLRFILSFMLKIVSVFSINLLLVKFFISRMGLFSYTTCSMLLLTGKCAAPARDGALLMAQDVRSRMVGIMANFSVYFMWYFLFKRRLNPCACMRVPKLSNSHYNLKIAFRLEPNVVIAALLSHRYLEYVM